MSTSADDPQIGPLDVDAAALAVAGEPLAALLDRLGVPFDPDDAEGAPATGWRVLKTSKPGSVVIGAPTHPDGMQWRIAEIVGGAPGASRPPVRIHPDTMPLRPSRAERAAGLALRWPPLSADEAARGVFVIDVVNTGATAWRPDGDPFLAIGLVTDPDVQPGTARFGFFGGQDAAVPLDPGEYARIHVRVDDNQWADREAGPYDLHVMLATLPVRTSRPLTAVLTAEQIESRRTRVDARARRVAESAEMRRQRRETQRQLTAGASRLEEIARVVAGSETVEDAVASLAPAFDGDANAARTIVYASLSQFTKSEIAGLGDGARYPD
ncbi:hypothetical protein [Microbacterium sp. CR_7]|uniref:hypothetical protein n=1 Tax=Microbacterium sp. CR_7 TaxID=3055792 RepID=UPI0035BFB8BD